MTSTQTLFTEALAAAAAKRGLTLAVDAEYANRGYFRFYKPDLTEVFGCRFDFQTDSARIRNIDGPLKAAWVLGWGNGMSSTVADTLTSVVAKLDEAVSS